MATLYTRINENAQKIFYGDITINGRRYRKKLATSKEAALKELKRWEYGLLFTSPEPTTKDQPITHARLSFLKDLELSSKLCDKYFNVFSYTTRRFMEYSHKHNAYNLDEVSSELARSFFHLRCKTRTKSKYKSSLDNYAPTLSTATVNKELQILKRFFNYCIDMEWVGKNPFRSVKAIKKKGGGGRYHFSNSDIEMIMQSAGRFHDFYYLLLHTGIRSTDAFKLKPEHFDGKYIKVQMNKTGDFLHVPIPECLYKKRTLYYGIFYGDYELTLNCGIKDISIGEKYSFDVIKDYNMKYTYGVLIKIYRISFSFSGYQSFIPMPAFNSYNGTISIGI